MCYYINIHVHAIAQTRAIYITKLYDQLEKTLGIIK